MNAAVKNRAPKKQADKKGLPVDVSAQAEQFPAFVQRYNSYAKLDHAKRVPPSKVINCARMIFFMRVTNLRIMLRIY